MTTNPIDAIQARADKAVGDGYRSTPWRPILNTAGDRHGVVSSDGCVVTTAEKDVAELLAHAPTDIAKLVAALRAVEAVHTKVNFDTFSVCGYCEMTDPCETITAIREALGE